MKITSVKRGLLNGLIARTGRTRRIHLGSSSMGSRLRSCTKQKTLNRGCFWRLMKRTVMAPDITSASDGQQTVCDDDNELECFVTYDTASKEERVSQVIGLIVQWTSSLPGGLERLVCIMMAVFLFLCILAVQIYIGILHEHRIRCRAFFLCSKPSTLTEVITFECQVKLLIVAWVCSMLGAWTVVAFHFICWCFTRWLTNTRAPQPAEICENNYDPHKHSLLDSIVTENETIKKHNE